MLIIYWSHSALEEIARAKDTYNHHLCLQTATGDKIYFFTNNEDDLRMFHNGLRWGANSGLGVLELDENISYA
jgi:hypothetical protein